MVSVVAVVEDPRTYQGMEGTVGYRVGSLVGAVLAELVVRLIVFAPVLLVLGTAFYLVGRLRRTGSTFLQAVFD